MTSFLNGIQNCSGGLYSSTVTNLYFAKTDMEPKQRRVLRINLPPPPCDVLIYRFQWQPQCVCVCQTLHTCTWYRAESREHSSWWTTRGERADRVLHAAADMNWEQVQRDGETEGGKTERGTAFLTRPGGGWSLCVALTYTHPHTHTHISTGQSMSLPGVRQLVSWCIQIPSDKSTNIKLQSK